MSTAWPSIAAYPASFSAATCTCTIVSGGIALGRAALLLKEPKKMARRGRIFARPRPASTTAPTGLQPLGAAAQRDSYLYVPAGYPAAEPRPLMLLLHGSGGHAHHGVD